MTQPISQPIAQPFRDIYCINCRCRTSNIDYEVKTLETGKRMHTAKCYACLRNKAMFFDEDFYTN